MPKSIKRTYSHHTRNAAALLGALIREARNERKLTAQELADRAGISRGLLQRIENGNLKCEIGAVFEVAAIVDVKLFDVDEKALTRQLNQTRVINISVSIFIGIILISIFTYGSYVYKNSLAKQKA